MLENLKSQREIITREQQTWPLVEQEGAFI